MPSFRDSLPLAADIPSARFHEKENPNFLPIVSPPVSCPYSLGAPGGQGMTPQP